MSEFLTIAEVLAIHSDQIRRFGGDSGIRDMGLLEAALFRPQTGYYGDVIQEAAALWESLSQNHPFVDGNKRTAFAATFVFLKLNGFRIATDWSLVGDEILAMHETGTFRFEAVERWLRAHTRKIEA